MAGRKSTRIVAVSSGKGGVGKTSISLNTALALAKDGYRVCLFDADLGLANINLLLGIDPEFTIEDTISGEKDISEIIIRDVHGIDIISGSSGVEKIANLDSEGLHALGNSLKALNEYDFLLFDTSAGIASPVTAFCMAASELLLVITPEPTSMTDAYSLLKVLLLNGYKGETGIVVNQCKNIRQVKKIFSSFQNVVSNFLKTKVFLAGFVLKDEKLAESVMKQVPFLVLYPETNASKCIMHLTKGLLSREPNPALNEGMGMFWNKCFGFLKNKIGMGDRDKKTVEDKESEKGSGIKSHMEKALPERINNDLTDMMGRIVRSMENISEELHDIKTCLKSGEGLKIDIAEEKGAHDFISMKEDGIILDYDEFLRNRMK